jgi:beta-phosphoglucomutase-like phosphatase (HAD superfamily)
VRRPFWRHLDALEKKQRYPLRLTDQPQDDEENTPDEVQDSEPKRVQANFDDMFKGMPSIDEMFEDSEIPKGGAEILDVDPDSLPSRREIDDTWFETIKVEIESKYADIKEKMLKELEEQRLEDPESVPDNAQLVMETIWQMELDEEIAAVRDKAAKELLAEYERDELEYTESRDLSNMEDSETAQRLKKDLREVQEQQAAVQARIDEFVKYEEDSFRRAAEKEVVELDAGKNLDDWALERLEEMLSTQDDLSVTDNLEESIEELRSKIEREKKRGSIRPETSKEWQMYRSIATRMHKNQTGDAEGSESQPVEDEGAISSQLESWKKFQEKEKSIRRKSGLTTGPKMPFEWHEAGKDPLSDLEASSSQVEDKRSRAEIRAEVNRKAIEAMEDMLRRNEGTSIGESLKRSIEALKSGIKADEAAEVENDKLFESDEATGPVDVSAIFDTSESSKQTFPTMPKESVKKTIVSPLETPFSSAPPDTPFFSGAGDDDVSTTSTSSRPPPNTPFFSDDGNDISTEPEILVTSKLGTLDEQKLRAMYRKAGAVTAEEQEKIKQQWDEFRTIEKQKRDISGLSDTDDSGSLGDATLSYDIADVLKDDGDIDVEKVMSKIGPRPTRSKRGTSNVPSSGSSGVTAASSASVTEESAAGSSEDSKPGERKGLFELDAEDIAEQVFRSVSAIGGGRTKDNPEAKAKEMAAFQEFVRKEDEYRENLDFVEESLTNSTLDELGIEETIVDESIDDDTYVKEVLAAVGPRPKRERKLSPTDAERVYSDTGGVLSDEEDEEDDDDDDDVDDETEEDDLGAVSAEDELVPEWLRGEKGTIRQAGSSDRGEDDEYEKNMRQLREYEQRRASNRPRQMGIDISDVLGGGMLSDDEYDKYSYDDNVSRGWERGRSFSSFDSRKRNLLDYTELSVQELNLLMDNKDSVLATGVSQYTPRINKPFRAFGAIFRLEGVLLDVTGFHYEAWKKTAEVHGFDPPRLEDVRFAAVTDAEIAARKVFFWTDDFLFCKDIARTHRGAMRDTFAKWMGENGISYSEPKENEKRNEQEAVESTNDRTPVGVENEADADRQLGAWILTAEQFGFTPPSLDEVIFASVVNADDAVVNAFRWTSDANIVSEIVRAYQGFLSDSADPEMSAPHTNGVADTSNTVEPFPSADPSRSAVTSSISSDPPTTLTENDILEIQYKTWLTIAEDRDFDPPTPDEALGAMVINDPALVIKDGFAWTDDPLLVQELVRQYQKLVGKLVRERSGIAASPEVDSQAEVSKEIGEETPKSTGPTMEELQEMKIYAWAAAAEKYDYDASFEEVQAAMLVDPEEAITRVFGWTQFDDVVRDLASTYCQELEKLAGKYNLKVGPRITKVASTSQSQSSKGPSNGELFQAAFDAWKEVAENRGFPVPNADQVQFSMTVGPEDGLRSFQWTEDPNERKDILADYIKAVQETVSKWQGEYTLVLDPKPKASPIDDKPPPYSIVPGADKWLQSLLDVEMACGVISYLDRDQVDVLLEQTGLDKFFPRDKCVSASNGYKLESQQMLGAALRIERRPDHCVVFGPTPESSVAAHDVEMKSVAMVGVYPMYELLNSDSTARYFDEFTAMNIRRLFGERVYDQPMMEALADRPEMKKQRKTRFWEEGDRI